MKQTVAIIGATGSMGSALSRNLAGGAYRLLLGGRDQEKLQRIVDDVRETYPAADVDGMTCAHEACWEADIIIIAVPFSAEREVAEKIRDVANQKIVVSIANPLNESSEALITAPDSSAAEELQKLLPNSKVVKAFNTTFAGSFNTPVLDGKRADGFIAGDDADALETVSALVATAGFHPVVAGDLKVSRTLEAMQLLLIKLGMKYGYEGLAGWKILHN